MKLTNETLKRLIVETMEEIEAAKARYRNAKTPEERKEAFLAWQAASAAHNAANPIQKKDAEFPEPPAMGTPRVKQPSVDDIYNAPSDSAYFSDDEMKAIAAASAREKQKAKTQSDLRRSAKEEDDYYLKRDPEQPYSALDLRPNMTEGLIFEGDASILEMFEDATLEEGGLVCGGCLFEMLHEASCGCPDLMGEAVYQGRTVTLNKPTRGDVKKFKVYVNSGKKDKEGRIKAKKVNFGQKGMKIKKSNPEKRANFRARHNCSTATDNKTPRYWSCKKW